MMTHYCSEYFLSYKKYNEYTTLWQQSLETTTLRNKNIYIYIYFYINKLKAHQQHVVSQIKYEYDPKISTWMQYNVLLNFPHSNAENETWHMV